MAAKKRVLNKRKKNISFESLDSVDLKKEVDIQAGEDAVQKQASVPQTPPKKTKPAPKKEELIRVTVDVPKSEHKRLKIMAMEKDLKLYQYVLQIIRSEIGE